MGTGVLVELANQVTEEKNKGQQGKVVLGIRVYLRLCIHPVVLTAAKDFLCLFQQWLFVLENEAPPDIQIY